MNRKIILVLGIACAFSSCYYDKEEILYPGAVNCSTVNAKFAADIMPLIQANCGISGCHDASSGNKGGPFTNYTQIKFKANIIKSQVLSGAMPQGSSLTPEQIRLISCWVDAGALNN